MPGRVVQAAVDDDGRAGATRPDEPDGVGPQVRYGARGGDGRLRAYDADTGRVLWQVDTARDWPTVSGETARGGSFGGGAGPVVADGRLIAMSGYGIYFHMPGNVMLVFGPRR